MKVFREDFDTRWLSLVSPPPTLLPGVDNGPLALEPGRHVDVHDICVLNDHVACLYSLQCRPWPAPRNGGGLLIGFRRRGRVVDVAGPGEFQRTFRSARRIGSSRRSSGNGGNILISYP